MSTTLVGRSDALTAAKAVVRDIGALKILISGLMLVPLLISLIYQEWYSAIAFLSAAVVTALVGGASYKRCEDAPEPKRHHAMIVAALTLLPLETRHRDNRRREWVYKLNVWI
ncbi:hypothetical protein [Halobellus rarus]|uniref:Uncharacterized protein n=1 Tax=Halobellus rarus TaxID=1126237 RepID=A0ABD6CL27_9EURY|nr:hypothetical protein [Halobellus rarus]